MIPFTVEVNTHWTEVMNSTKSSSQAAPAGCAIDAAFPRERDTIPPAEVYATTICILLVNSVTFPFTTILNMLVIAAVKTKSQLKTKCNVMIACLAVTDFLVGVFMQPLFNLVLIDSLHREASTFACYRQIILKNGLRILGAASVYHLVFMIIERFLGIFYPYTYNASITTRRILAASLCVWTAAFLFSIHPLFDKTSALTVNIFIFWLALAIIVMGQFPLYREARRHEKAIIAQKLSPETKQKFLKEKKALKTTTFVIISVLVFHLPATFIRLIRSTSNIPMNVAAVFNSIGGFLLILNSLVNPIIYATRKRQFRVAFLEIILRKTQIQSQQIESRIFGSANTVHVLHQIEERGRNQRDSTSVIQNSRNQRDSKCNPRSDPIDVVPNQDTKTSLNATQDKEIN